MAQQHQQQVGGGGGGGTLVMVKGTTTMTMSTTDRRRPMIYPKIEIGMQLLPFQCIHYLFLFRTTAY